MSEEIERSIKTDKTGKKQVWLILFILIALALGGYLVYWSFLKDNSNERKNNGEKTASTGVAVKIPAKVLANKFGFLAGGEPENPFVGEVGGAWVRPHPGPFLWDAMQSGTGTKIDFVNTDKVVQSQQDQNYGTLATLWPFANWDQEISGNASNCQVSTNDEFLPQSEASLNKGRQDYLPKYRCKPVDWDKYEYWVKQVVERYDGDGIDDMAGLKIPIKYWEVMNEPDLTSPESEPRLDFWKGNEADYAELLIKTNKIIKEADSGAKVVIAGVAGGNNQFLNFYREVWKNPETLTAFDISNVHCISNDSYDSFNVEPYKKLLAEFNLKQPIWVTEAEAIVSSDPDINATATKEAAAKAFSLGAERIFFTQYSFKPMGGGNLGPKNMVTIQATLKGSDAKEAYRAITVQ